MISKKLIKYVQMIQLQAAQGIGAVGLATIFEKMGLFWALCRAGVAIEKWDVAIWAMTDAAAAVLPRSPAGSVTSNVAASLAELLHRTQARKGIEQFLSQFGVFIGHKF